MRELVRSGLRVLGLSTRREVDNLRNTLQKREQENASLRVSLKTARKREGKLTSRAAGLERQVGSLKQAVCQWKELTEAARAKEKATAGATKEAGHRTTELAAVVRDLRNRLDTAENALLVPRDQLMATETKLDLLEAAINLLDQRTRGSLDTRG